MNNRVKNDLSNAKKFYENNKAIIMKNLKEGSVLHCIELDSKELSKIFDMYAGVDYALFNRKLSKLTGVAARVNFWSGTKNCITIRYKRKSGTLTEYSKRLDSILNDDSIYPQLTMQVDDNNGVASNGIIIKTKDLYLYINDHFDEIKNKYMRTCKEGNDYLRIPYAVIESLNIPCRKIVT